MAHRRILWLALAAAALACGSDGVTETDTVNGVKYTARFVGNVSSGTGTFTTVIATLQNVSSSSQDRDYPVSCPVRIRLYRPADGFKMYDETRSACVSDTATLSIPVSESRELQSGIRTAEFLLGDSLPYQTYAVRAVVQTEGANELEVVAGAWTFTQPAPAPPAARRQ